MSKIDVSNMDLYYGDFHALKNINLSIDANEVTAFIGPSGCGKSTLLKSINRMNDLVPGCRITGEMLLDGENIYGGKMDVNGLRKRVGMVFQKPNPFPMSIYDNIAYGPRTHGVRSKAKLDDIVEQSLRQAAIWDEVKDRLKKSALGMSGGQQQRVAIARTLAPEPQVLFMDEPLSNLDAKLRIEMRNAIKQIQRRVDITTVYVTHDQAEAMSLSDKIIIMNKGHIEQVGTPHEVYQHPASRFVADFIGSANFVEAKVSEGDSEGEMIPVRMLNEDFNVHYAGLPVKAGDTVQIVLRPEAIRLADSGDVEAEVISSTYMGAVQEYVVRAGDKELETEEYNPEGKRIYRPGDKVWLRIQRGALHAVEN